MIIIQFYMEGIGRHSLSAIPAASAKKSSSAAADRCPLQFFHFLVARRREERRGEARRGEVRRGGSARREGAEGEEGEGRTVAATYRRSGSMRIDSDAVETRSKLPGSARPAAGPPASSRLHTFKKNVGRPVVVFNYVYNQRAACLW